ncbi:hypothetical protein ABW20_dc0101472 [Dactylellina cionopaga]|nr:hypothetical protein ABW20_dc0101472 [Dactylellina cionopaga]
MSGLGGSCFAGTLLNTYDEAIDKPSRICQAICMRPNPSKAVRPGDSDDITRDDYEKMLAGCGTLENIRKALEDNCGCYGNGRYKDCIIKFEAPKDGGSKTSAATSTVETSTEADNVYPEKSTTLTSEMQTSTEPIITELSAEYPTTEAVTLSTISSMTVSEYSTAGGNTDTMESSTGSIILESTVDTTNTEWSTTETKQSTLIEYTRGAITTEVATTTAEIEYAINSTTETTPTEFMSLITETNRYTTMGDSPTEMPTDLASTTLIGEPMTTIPTNEYVTTSAIMETSSTDTGTTETSIMETNTMDTGAMEPTTTPGDEYSTIEYVSESTPAYPATTPTNTPPSGYYVVKKCFTANEGQYPKDGKTENLKNCIKDSAVEINDLRSFCTHTCTSYTPEFAGMSSADLIIYQKIYAACSSDAKRLALALAGACGCLNEELGETCEIPQNEIIMPTTSSNLESYPSATSEMPMSSDISTTATMLPTTSLPEECKPKECPKDTDIWPQNCLNRVSRQDNGAIVEICLSMCTETKEQTYLETSDYNRYKQLLPECNNSHPELIQALMEGCGCILPKETAAKCMFPKMPPKEMGPSSTAVGYTTIDSKAPSSNVYYTPSSTSDMTTPDYIMTTPATQTSTTGYVENCPKNYLGKGKWPIGNCLDEAFASDSGMKVAEIVCNRQCADVPLKDWPVDHMQVYELAQAKCTTPEDLNYALANGCGCLNDGWIKSCRPQCQPPQGYASSMSGYSSEEMISTSSTSSSSMTLQYNSSMSMSSMPTPTMTEEYSYSVSTSTSSVETSEISTMTTEMTTEMTMEITTGMTTSWTTTTYVTKSCDYCESITITTTVPCPPESTNVSTSTSTSLWMSSETSAMYLSSTSTPIVTTMPTTESLPAYSQDITYACIITTSTYTLKDCETCEAKIITTTIPCATSTTEMPTTLTSTSDMYTAEKSTTDMSTTEISTAETTEKTTVNMSTTETLTVETSWTITTYVTKPCKRCIAITVTTKVPCSTTSSSTPEMFTTMTSTSEMSTTTMATETLPMTTSWTTTTYVTKPCHECHPTTITMTVPCPQTVVTVVYTTKSCDYGNCGVVAVTKTVTITPAKPTWTTLPLNSMVTVTYATTNAPKCTCGNQIPQCTVPPGPPQVGRHHDRCNQWYYVKPGDNCQKVVDGLDDKVKVTDIMEWNDVAKENCEIWADRWLCVGTLTPTRKAVYATALPSYMPNPEKYPSPNTYTPYPDRPARPDSPSSTMPAGMYTSTETPQPTAPQDQYSIEPMPTTTMVASKYLGA